MDEKEEECTASRQRTKEQSLRKIKPIGIRMQTIPYATSNHPTQDEKAERERGRQETEETRRMEGRGTWDDNYNDYRGRGGEERTT